MKRIYLDYAATTPLDPKVLEAMMPYLKEEYGNASSIHRPGQRAKEAVDKAREKLSNFLNCSPSEIVFTGSATEANNLAIFGVIKAIQKKGSNRNDRHKMNQLKPHIITTKIEHHAILETCRALEAQGVEVTYLPVDKQGLVKVEDVKKAIKPNTTLVSIMYANNEIGTIQPITEIGKFLKDTKILFHTDAVQAINYLDCDVERLGVDLLTLSSHKIYGPKGVGALYIKKGTSIEPIIYGGGQEQGLRSGTENVAGIVGLGAAIAQIKTGSKYDDRNNLNQGLKTLRNKLIDGILEKIAGAKLNGSREQRLPNNVNFSFKGAEGEALVIALDQEGIAASTGSACSSKSLEPSHVLLALGLTPEQAHGSLRLTLGRYTTEKEIERVLEVLPEVVKRLRRISGIKIKNQKSKCNSKCKKESF